MYLLFLAHFNPLNAELNLTCDLLALLEARHIFHVSGHMFEKYSEYQISRKYVQWGLSSMPADGAEMTKLIVDFRNFPNAPKKDIPWRLSRSQGPSALYAIPTAHLPETQRSSFVLLCIP